MRRWPSGGGGSIWPRCAINLKHMGCCSADNIAWQTFRWLESMCEKMVGSVPDQTCYPKRMLSVSQLQSFCKNGMGLTKKEGSKCSNSPHANTDVMCKKRGTCPNNAHRSAAYPNAGTFFALHGARIPEQSRPGCRSVLPCSNKEHCVPRPSLVLFLL